jgi:two-component system, sensor histidine kinase LadS
LKKSIVLIYFSVIIIASLQGQTGIVLGLDNTHNTLNIKDFAYFYSDTEGVLTVDDLRDSLHNNKWQLLPNNYLQLGYKNDYFWVRLSVEAKVDLADEWYLWFDAAITQQAKLYVFDGTKCIFSDTLGVNYPFYQRKIISRYPIIPLHPKKGQILTVYACFHNDITSLKGYLRLTTKNEYHVTNLQESINYIGYFTFLILSAIVSLALWLFWKENIYILFALYIFCCLQMSAGFKGFSTLWFWPNVPYLAYISRGIWTVGCVIFFLQFEKALLFEKKDTPYSLAKWVQFLSILLGIFALIGLFYMSIESGRMMIKFANITLLLSLFTVIFMPMMVKKEFRHTAFYFFMAFLPIVIVGISIILHNNKIYPNYFGRSEMPFVAAQIFEVAFLFIAIFKRFQIIKENQKKQELQEQQSKQQIQDERERIGRELHDNVGARLAHLIGQIDNLEYRLERDKSEESVNNTIEKLENVGENARGVMNILRETIWAVKEESIPTELFAAKIRSYLQSNMDDSITCDVHAHCENDMTLSPGQALNMFRIVQEACQNALKHAEASHININIICKNNVLDIVIRDNGKGFDLPKNHEHPSVSEPLDGHYGLKNMQFRAIEIGSTMIIESETGKGTVVHLKMIL